jgi:hypothetical protein
MTIELTNDEKLGILDQHIKSIEYTIYGAELDLIEAQSVSTTDASVIAGINDRLANANSKKTALLAERSDLI